ncbi:hypothetical protein SDC9_119263 [bioreactor metagenome]|uniref:Uncharacterized protein n=1 Tax=bioreactor metagenome TaxID=1076179 RepID=A0A645C3D9_9ZZZZ
MFERLENRAAGDFVKTHPLEIALEFLAQHLPEVPGDGLPFAVRVGREVDFDGLFGGGLQVGDGPGAARTGDVLGGEVMFDIDAEFALGQIADMAHRGHDFEIVSDHPGDGARLGRRLNDQKFAVFGTHGIRPEKNCYAYAFTLAHRTAVCQAALI